MELESPILFHVAAVHSHLNIVDCENILSFINPFPGQRIFVLFLVLTLPSSDAVNMAPVSLGCTLGWNSWAIGYMIVNFIR